MNFKTMLNEFKKLNNFNLYDLVVAEEMDFLNEELSDNDFETLCQVAKNAHLKSEYCSIQQVVNAIYQLLQDGMTTEEISETDYFDILEIAAEY